MSAHWVKTGLTPMVGPLPGWVVLPLPFTLFNWAHWWGWAPLVFNIVLAVWLRSKGRTLTWMVRKIKAKLRGNMISARTVGYRRVQTTDVPAWLFDFEAWRMK